MIENAKMKVATACVIAVAGIGILVGEIQWRNSMSAKIDALTIQMGDRYTLTMAAENALREAMANPGHSVPDPRNPGQFFSVRAGSGSVPPLNGR